MPSADRAPVPLQIPRYAHLLVDAAHQHLFISEGVGNSGILVTDFNGQAVTTIPGTLIATDSVTEPPCLERYDVSSGTPVKAVRTWLQNSAFVDCMLITPDGQDLVWPPVPRTTTRSTSSPTCPPTGLRLQLADPRGRRARLGARREPPVRRCRGHVREHPTLHALLAPEATGTTLPSPTQPPAGRTTGRPVTARRG